MDKRKKFKMRWYHRRPKFWFKRDRPRPPGFRVAPEVVRFGPAPGVAPSDKPPVRIFLGTEPMQARAERVFLWSVNVVRDPARSYEIHLMKDLAGYDRNGWTTGFTNYRYAIPALGGAAGRGIYNDVDQIYLADPAPMFDLDMNGAALLCVAEDDTSVSLIDCGRMASQWRVEDAQKGYKRGHFLKILADNKLWGRLAPEWNARDAEYEAGRSKCFHFTTLRTQPWRPFEDQLRYALHPDREVWLRLEREADKARFNAFTRESPGSHFAEALGRIGATAGAGDEARHAKTIEALISATGAKSVLDYSPPAASGARRWAGASVERPTAPLFASPVSGSFDGVASIDALSGMPEEDVPWLLDELFRAAGRFVYVAVALDRTPDFGRAEALPKEWWRLQLELAANRAPGKKWALTTTRAGRARTVRG